MPAAGKAAPYKNVYRLTWHHVSQTACKNDCKHHLEQKPAYLTPLRNRASQVMGLNCSPCPAQAKVALAHIRALSSADTPGMGQWVTAQHYPGTASSNPAATAASAGKPLKLHFTLLSLLHLSFFFLFWAIFIFQSFYKIWVQKVFTEPTQGLQHS